MGVLSALSAFFGAPNNPADGGDGTRVDQR